MRNHNGNQGRPGLYAAGFNAFDQLCINEEHNLQTFEEVIPQSAENTTILWAGWSSTVLLSREILSSRGFRSGNFDCDSDLSNIHSAFGDIDGLLGCLDYSGHVFLVENDPNPSLRLRLQIVDDSLRLTHAARSQTGRIAVAFFAPEYRHECSVAEFDCLESFAIWLKHPNAETGHVQMISRFPGRAQQLEAGAAGFVLLLKSGRVYTWGDPRHQSLGRATKGSDSVPAGKPGLVEALDGLSIIKVAAGGWLGAALSADKALYLWGTTTPGQPEKLEALRDTGPAEIALVEIIMDASSEPLDVVDVSLGDNHVAVVCDQGRVFVAGENKNHQLGLGQNAPFCPSWGLAGTFGNTCRVKCGPLSTFLEVR